ncbi:MAG: helicase-related protein [Spirochaetia bacterium]|jgi:superfamily II DNA or RNA helicase
MLRLEELKKDVCVEGIMPGHRVKVVSTDMIGADAVTVVYETTNGALAKRTLFRDQEAQLSISDEAVSWTFDAPGGDFTLVTEAYRINLAQYIDPMLAVYSSNVELLPHQIAAVYETMLHKHPLRFLLADDPGAGKTIMAGLLISELLMRADIRKVLIVAPGSLVEQWQDEMATKFGLSFTLFSRSLVRDSVRGNPFQEQDLLIARIDQLSRFPEFQDKLRESAWDMIIVDEAHKCSAPRFGNRIEKTQRFKLAEDVLGKVSRHFLLMTATPHNGHEEDFQTFLSLLDPDRFFARSREPAERQDINDVMLRRNKESLLKFDGSPLFPARFAYTINYELSALEQDLYEAVTTYVREEMNKADRLDGKRKGSIGFALTMLQRRLASSPEAIYQSLKRRRERLMKRVAEEKDSGSAILDALATDAPDEDDLPDQEFEAQAEEVIDEATTARTIRELEIEIDLLTGLEEKAFDVVRSDEDRKWEELSKLLQDEALFRTPQGAWRKFIIFTEHRDTLNYLQKRITGLLGDERAVQCIHGGVPRDARREIQDIFWNDPVVKVLVATDAAGEGINLQVTNLMINYDLPWNPNRIEQRFGRIHRIGQTEVCHLWNLVSQGTREGEVFNRLFDKLAAAREALGGRVFDVLGEVFEGTSLKDLIIEAIRRDARAENTAEDSQKKLDQALDLEHFREVMQREALCEDVITTQRLLSLKEEMERIEARKMQPHHVRSFFLESFKRLSGRCQEIEPGRFELRYVPAEICARARRLDPSQNRSRETVVSRYERVCFQKELIRVFGKPHATFLHPGHPLIKSIVSLIIEKYERAFQQGAVLVDPWDADLEPQFMFVLDHTVQEGGSQHVLSRLVRFVKIDRSGQAQDAAWAPHLDLRAITDEERILIGDVLNDTWVTTGLEKRALAFAVRSIVPAHYASIRESHEQAIDRQLDAVRERLTREIAWWDKRTVELKAAVAAGNPQAHNLENARRTVDELSVRLKTRVTELSSRRDTVSLPPVVVSGALIIPRGLLESRKGNTEFAADAQARAAIEKIAMDTVMETEAALGNAPEDVSARNEGWDITSRPPMKEVMIPNERHIEVKGRVAGQKTITVSRNEIISGLNFGPKYILAIVIVDGAKREGPWYVVQPFQKEPDFGVDSSNYDLKDLLARAVRPEKTG